MPGGYPSTPGQAGMEMDPTPSCRKAIVAIFRFGRKASIL